jgi:hypothetical protein
MKREKSRIDWDAEAVAMADHVGHEMFAAHRGAMWWRRVGVSVVFGNDGYAVRSGGRFHEGELRPVDDPRPRREVALVREVLAKQGIEVLGFGTSSGNGYSWAMLVQTDDRAMLESVVWQAWDVACGGRSEIDPEMNAVHAGNLQLFHAREAIAHAVTPDHWAN